MSVLNDVYSIQDVLYVIAVQMSGLSYDVYKTENVHCTFFQNDFHFLCCFSSYD